MHTLLPFRRAIFDSSVLECWLFILFFLRPLWAKEKKKKMISSSIGGWFVCAASRTIAMTTFHCFLFAPSPSFTLFFLFISSVCLSKRQLPSLLPPLAPSPSKCSFTGNSGSKCSTVRTHWDDGGCWADGGGGRGRPLGRPACGWLLAAVVMDSRCCAVAACCRCTSYSTLSKYCLLAGAAPCACAARRRGSFFFGIDDMAGVLLCG